MNPIIPQRIIILDELITHDYGCMIVSMPCANAERYAFLPAHITRRGVRCNRVSFHPDTQKVYYRSETL